VEDTIRFAKELDPDYVNFHVAIPFPGTELYTTAKQNGWLVHEDWEKYEEMGSAVLRTATFTPEMAMNAQQQATRAIYMRPGRILKELSRLRSFQDFKLRASAALRLFGVTEQK
jgi:radical SAM superfamily enzyme YgiQ (UPF0313 family)